MEDIRRVIERAAWRLALGRFGFALLISATAALVGLAALVVAQRLFAFTMDWNMAWIAAGVVSLLGAALWAAWRRPGRVDVARRLDEGAGLRETLSTAVCLEGADDAWSKAAIESARHASGRVIVRQALPFRTPKAWPAPIGAAVAFVLCWTLLPQWDVLGALAGRGQNENKVVEVAHVQEQIAASEERLKSMLEGLETTLDEGELTDDVGAPRDPDEVRRAAIRKLTSLADELADMQFGEDAVAMEQIKDALSDLRQPGPGPLDELVQALQEGDFGAARDALENLQKQIDSGAMAPEQQQHMQEQMKALSEQLGAMSQANKDLQEALEQAGMDPSLANDPNALREALENNPNLSEAQKEALEQAANAAQKASSQMNQMCQNAGQCSNPGGMGAGMSAMSEQLSAMEAMAARSSKAGAAMKEAMAQLDQLAGELGETDYDLLSMMNRPKNPGEQGQWSPGGANCPPGGSSSQAGKGGRGQGQGATGNTAEAAFKTKEDKVIGQDHGGPIVSSMLVKGAQVKGESRAEFASVVSKASAAAAEAIETNQAPREYHDAIKRYFGRLEAKAKGEPVPSDAPATPAPEPAPTPETPKP